MEQIGRFLRQKREAKNLSIRQLAKYTGVSPAYISQLENNYRKNPTTHVLKALFEGLGLKYDEALQQLNQLSKEEIKERKQFAEIYLTSDKRSVDKKEPIYLYELLNDPSQTIYYKEKQLTINEKRNILTILQTLFE